MRLVSVVCLCLATSACVFNLGDVAGAETTSQTRSVESFDAIAISGSVDVQFETGSEVSIEVVAVPKVIDDIVTEVDDRTLQVGLEGGLHINTGRMLVKVTAPSLKSLSIDGSGDATISGIDEERLSLSVSGSGDIEADGEAEAVSIAVSGSGDVEGRALKAASAHVSVRGSGDISISATEAAKGSISGSGDISVHGGATCAISVSGSGDVNC